MKPFFSLLLLAVFSYSVVGQAPNCTQLNVRANLTSPRAGNNLPYCRTSEQQCCSAQYLRYKAMDLRDVSLVDGLLHQITGNGDVLDRITQGLRSYINTTFIPRFVRLLDYPVLNMSGDLSPHLQTLRSRFFIRPPQPNEANFTVQGFTRSVIISHNNLIVSAIIAPQVMHNNATPPLVSGSRQRECVDNYLFRRVNQTTKSVIDSSVQELRLAVTAIDRLNMWFYGTFLPNITTRFRPLNICVEAFIDQTCQECVENIPGLCRGVCNAITYGCYAFVQQDLRGQFNVLWNVTNQLVNISREAIRNVSSLLPNHLLPVETTVNITMIREIAQTCNFNLRTTPSSTRKRRQSPTIDDNYRMIMIPDNITRNATYLEGRGLVDYGTEAPYFCRNNRNRDCWNGTATVNRYVPDFNGTTLDDQVDNPFFRVNLTELREEAGSYGNPVTDFLSNDSFLEVAPQGLVLPEDTPSNSGAAEIMVSSLVLVFITVLSLFLL